MPAANNKGIVTFERRTIEAAVERNRANAANTLERPLV